MCVRQRLKMYALKNTVLNFHGDIVNLFYHEAGTGAASRRANFVHVHNMSASRNTSSRKMGILINEFFSLVWNPKDHFKHLDVCFLRIFKVQP